MSYQWAGRSAWQIIITPKARHELERLSPQTKSRVVESRFSGLAKEGRGDVVKLHGVSEVWRLRVGDWRVRFRRDSPAHAIVVLQVLPRGQGYRR